MKGEQNKIVKTSKADFSKLRIYGRATPHLWDRSCDLKSDWIFEKTIQIPSGGLRVLFIFFKNKIFEQKKKSKKKVEIFIFFKIRVRKTIMKFEHFSQTPGRYWYEVTSEQKSSFSNKWLDRWGVARFTLILRTKNGYFGAAPPPFCRRREISYFF